MATLTVAGLPAPPNNPTTGQPYTSHTQYFFYNLVVFTRCHTESTKLYAAANATYQKKLQS
jgi:hypothetical protein